MTGGSAGIGLAAAEQMRGQAPPDVARTFRASERRCHDGETLARQRGVGWPA
jgi:hypothetical protein